MFLTTPRHHIYNQISGVENSWCEDSSLFGYNAWRKANKSLTNLMAATLCCSHSQTRVSQDRGLIYYVHNATNITIVLYLSLTLLDLTKSYKNYLQNTQHGKACLSKQSPWRAAGDPRLAPGRSRVRAPGPAGALRALFFSTLPSFLLQEIVFFAPSPPNL